MQFDFFSSFSNIDITIFPSLKWHEKHGSNVLETGPKRKFSRPSSFVTLVDLLHCRQQKRVISSPPSYHSSWTGVSCRCNVPRKDKTLLREQFRTDELTSGIRTNYIIGLTILSVSDEVYLLTRSCNRLFYCVSHERPMTNICYVSHFRYNEIQSYLLIRFAVLNVFN